MGVVGADGAAVVLDDAVVVDAGGLWQQKQHWPRESLRRYWLVEQQNWQVSLDPEWPSTV